jgi:hypothetical protein
VGGGRIGGGGLKVGERRRGQVVGAGDALMKRMKSSRSLIFCISHLHRETDNEKRWR